MNNRYLMEKSIHPEGTEHAPEESDTYEQIERKDENVKSEKITTNQQELINSNQENDANQKIVVDDDNVAANIKKTEGNKNISELSQPNRDELLSQTETRVENNKMEIKCVKKDNNEEVISKDDNQANKNNEMSLSKIENNGNMPKKVEILIPELPKNIIKEKQQRGQTSKDEEIQILQLENTLKSADDDSSASSSEQEKQKAQLLKQEENNEKELGNAKEKEHKMKTVKTEELILKEQENEITQKKERDEENIRREKVEEAKRKKTGNRKRTKETGRGR